MDGQCGHFFLGTYFCIFPSWVYLVSCLFCLVLWLEITRILPKCCVVALIQLNWILMRTR